MPARLPLTPEEAIDRIREKTRERVKRYRERRNASGNATTASNGAHTHEGAPARSTSSSLRLLSTTTKREDGGGDFEQVRCVLEPLRGYVHDEHLLHRLAATCPAVDLVVEAIGMAEWLNRTANRKRACSKAFLSNWVKRAATLPVRGVEPVPLHAPRPPARSALARVLHQIATDPVDGPSTWGTH